MSHEDFESIVQPMLSILSDVSLSWHKSPECWRCKETLHRFSTNATLANHAFKGKEKTYERDEILVCEVLEKIHHIIVANKIHDRVDLTDAFSLRVDVGVEHEEVDFVNRL